MEFLVRIVGKSGDPENRRSFRAGDVVCIKPDGGPWGKAEREAPYWTILTANIPRVEAVLLSQNELDPDAARTNLYLRHRLKRLDLSALPASRLAVIAAQRQASGLLSHGATYVPRAVESMPLSAAQFRALVTDVPRDALDPRGA